MQTLIGQIEHVLFEDNGFFIAVLKSKEKISGTYYESDVSHLKGAAITLKGEYVEHPKYAQSFKFESLHVNQNELFFFLNRVIKGFSKKLTADMIEKYGEAGLIDILDNDIEKLLDNKGIKAKRLKSIQASWKQFRSLRSLGEFLIPFGVTPTLLSTIANALKDVKEPQRKIRENPYILTSITGIGFRKADEIALKMGVELRSPQRVSAAMDSLLNQLCDQEGNSAVMKDNLFSKMDEALEFYGENKLYESVLLERINEHSIKEFPSHLLAPDRLYEAELFLYERFTARAKENHGVITKDLEGFLKDSEFPLAEQQREALEVINSGVSILSLVGYAGTGKSTTAKSILKLLNRRYHEKEIITCALSGIASQRIGERSGYESATIQSLLVKFDTRDSMPYKVVLIDEASMINSMLFARFLAKVRSDGVIIIVGDDAQLPPIGAGSVLGDILSLELTPIVKLTKIFRQSEEQAIAMIANNIREGSVPEYQKSYDDFHFIDVSIANYYAMKNSLNSREIAEVREHNSQEILVQIARETLSIIPESRKLLKEKKIREYLNFFQVITPMRGGLLGVDNLNKVLQEYFNPSQESHFERNGVGYRLWDKVVHLKNDNMPSFSMDDFKLGSDSQERRIFNGMIGLLFKIDSDADQVYVFFPNEAVVVRYEKEQIRTHLMLSYALTIHKVQGMEYEKVVIPMSFSHYIMHNTKLLYTAITRAKKECYIIGEAQAFESACKRLDVTKRITVMQELGEK
ncbi:MAG: AAA family ATPase [Campylobacterota bacterium]|nr:AAA family ATPase [Campylobacterota bacterium]